MSQDDKERKVYSQREKVLLLNLVDDYKNIIECKKPNSVSLRVKQDAWVKIATKHNENDVTKRTGKQLKKLWDNIKQRTRKADSGRKIGILKTGGGPPPGDDDNPINEKVRSIVPTIDYEIDNASDSITVFKEKDSEKQIEFSPDRQDPLEGASHQYVSDHDYDKKTAEGLNEDKRDSEKKCMECNYYSKEPKKRKRRVSEKSVNKNFVEEAILRKRKVTEVIIQEEEIHKKKNRSSSCRENILGSKNSAANKQYLSKIF